MLAAPRNFKVIAGAELEVVENAADWLEIVNYEHYQEGAVDF